MKKIIAMALVGCICLLSVAQADETDNVPIYSRKEYKDGYDTAATLGAMVGVVCMAEHPITKKTRSAEKHMEKIDKCIEDKLRERGIIFKKYYR